MIPFATMHKDTLYPHGMESNQMIRHSRITEFQSHACSLAFSLVFDSSARLAFIAPMG
jgi:hypothetical protein